MAATLITDASVFQSWLEYYHIAWQVLEKAERYRDALIEEYPFGADPFYQSVWVLELQQMKRIIDNQVKNIAAIEQQVRGIYRAIDGKRKWIIGTCPWCHQKTSAFSCTRCGVFHVCNADRVVKGKPQECYGCLRDLE